MIVSYFSLFAAFVYDVPLNGSKLVNLLLEFSS